MKYISKLFQPLITLPKNAVVKHQDITSKSQRLMVENGIIKPSSGTGLFSYLPLGMRAMNKLISLVDSKMEEIDAQKCSLPILVSNDLWCKTGRYQNAGPELMRMKDRHNKYFILGPTHEETITDLIAQVSPISPKNLPLRLYQIDTKYRDEMRPRYGVIRSREFMMKDLYTFDIDKEASINTYELVTETYNQIFSSIGINYIKVEGNTGTIGGVLSHEYHYLCDIGEETLLECTSCNYRITKEHLNALDKDAEDSFKCPKCSGTSSSNYLGIEVGHTFVLGTKYTNPLDAFTLGSNSLHMGCYGLGLSRIIGASIEVLSTESEIRWPLLLAPYTICIIGPKSGSKEFDVANPLVEEIYSLIVENCDTFYNDIIIDDRNTTTIGKRVLFAKRCGYPFIVIVGKRATEDEPKFEVLEVNKNKILILTLNELIKLFQNVALDVQQRISANYMENFSISTDELTENSLK